MLSLNPDPVMVNKLFMEFSEVGEIDVIVGLIELLYSYVRISLGNVSPFDLKRKIYKSK